MATAQRPRCALRRQRHSPARQGLTDQPSGAVFRVNLRQSGATESRSNASRRTPAHRPSRLVSPKANSIGAFRTVAGRFAPNLSMNVVKRCGGLCPLVKMVAPSNVLPRLSALQMAALSYRFSLGNKQPVVDPGQQRGERFPRAPINDRHIHIRNVVPQRWRLSAEF